MEGFFCKTKIIIGAGSIAALGKWNIQRLMLVCDPFFRENGFAQAILRAAGEPEHLIFSQITPDPAVTLAAQGTAAVKEFKPDTVVALGGGSTMDAAKAMCYFSGLAPKLVAIPTTCGSGSEVTDFAILTHEGTKHPLVDEKLKPDVAIIDRDLVASLPAPLVAEGGFDMVSHVLEAYVATGHNCISDALAEHAFKSATEHLLPAWEGNLNCRGYIHEAATMAGIAFSQAGLGVCHAISHSIGGAFHTPHGRLNAILLPAVIEQNATCCGTRYAHLARQAGLSSGCESMAVRALKNTLSRMRRAMAIPDTLADAGIDPRALKEKLETIVDAALADPCCATNPRTVDREMIRTIISEVSGHG